MITVYEVIAGEHGVVVTCRTKEQAEKHAAYWSNVREKRVTTVVRARQVESEYETRRALERSLEVYDAR